VRRRPPLGPRERQARDELKKFLTSQWRNSGSTLAQIAETLGYNTPSGVQAVNQIFRNGRVPLGRLVNLAHALNVPALELLRRVLAVQIPQEDREQLKEVFFAETANQEIKAGLDLREFGGALVTNADESTQRHVIRDVLKDRHFIGGELLARFERVFPKHRIIAAAVGDYDINELGEQIVANLARGVTYDYVIATAEGSYRAFRAELSPGHRDRFQYKVCSPRAQVFAMYKDGGCVYDPDDPWAVGLRYAPVRNDLLSKNTVIIDAELRAFKDLFDSAIHAGTKTKGRTK
jgi:transcriptional regulator with XRE-family HTH domain